MMIIRTNSRKMFSTAYISGGIRCRIKPSIPIDLTRSCWLEIVKRRHNYKRYSFDLSENQYIPSNLVQVFSIHATNEHRRLQVHLTIVRYARATYSRNSNVSRHHVLHFSGIQWHGTYTVCRFCWKTEKWSTKTQQELNESWSHGWTKTRKLNGMENQNEGIEIIEHATALFAGWCDTKVELHVRRTSYTVNTRNVNVPVCSEQTVDVCQHRHAAAQCHSTPFRCIHDMVCARVYADRVEGTYCLYDNAVESTFTLPRTQNYCLVLST